MPPVLATHFKHGDCLKTVPALLVEEAFRKVWAWRPARPEPPHHPKHLQQEQRELVWTRAECCEGWTRRPHGALLEGRRASSWPLSTQGP